VRSNRWRFLLLVVLASGLLTPGPAAAQMMGLFFDRAATVCSTTIEPFSPVCDSVYVVLFPPPGILLGGVTFRLELPSDIEVCGFPPQVSFPRNDYIRVDGSLELGYDARFSQCVSADGPRLVAQFAIADVRLGPGPRTNLVLHLVGAMLDTATATLTPQALVCDPEHHPDGTLGTTSLRSIDAYLNCTKPCGCTTAVAPCTWAAVKQLFREP
jgi:hypothetical protein